MIVAAFIESLRADALAVIGDIQMGIMGFNSTIISVSSSYIISTIATRAHNQLSTLLFQAKGFQDSDILKFTHAVCTFDVCMLCIYIHL